MKKNTKEDKAEWTNPAYVAFLNPFCIIRPDEENDFTVDLKEINENTYNHGLLCRIVAPLSSPELERTSLLLCADGALAVPAVPELQKLDDVLDVFNGVMCRLLLGGHLCEAVDSRDIVSGNLHEKRAIWPTDLGQSMNAYAHSTMRMKIASPFNSVQLSNPKNIPVSDFLSRYEAGRILLGGLPNVSPTLLLRGFTELRYLNLVDALSNLWIVVEQLTELLWKKQFLANSSNHPENDIPKRRQALDQDTRTWSTSVRLEILFQKSIVPSTTFSKLYPARKARNDLVHKGLRPSQATVIDLFSAVLDLIQVITGIDPVALRSLDIKWIRDFHVRRQYDLYEWNDAKDKFK